MINFCVDLLGNNCYLVLYFFVEFVIFIIGGLYKEGRDKLIIFNINIVFLEWSKLYEERCGKCFIEFSKKNLGCGFDIF